jgi:hypothetical protein
MFNPTQNLLGKVEGGAGGVLMPLKCAPPATAKKRGDVTLGDRGELTPPRCSPPANLTSKKTFPKKRGSKGAIPLLPPHPTTENITNKHIQIIPLVVYIINYFFTIFCKMKIL